MAKYRLFNQDIIFPDSAERFFDMQYRVWKALDAASRDFDTWYKNCGDILTALKGYEKKATELVIHYANSPLFNELTDLGIYDISEDRYDEDCLDFSALSEALDTIAQKYNEIIAEQEAEEEYRAERKANRGRVVGGGFGVGGALKGMAAAGAMNAISGAGHGLVNAIGNAGSALAAASSKKSLYNSEATLKVLKEGIKTDILSCFNAHIHLLNERLDSYMLSCFDSDKAGALFESAKKVIDKQQELLIESFKNCPWNNDLLAFIFTNYKTERKNTWEIGKRFHVDLHDIAEQAFAASYTDEIKSSEEESQKCKKDILSQMRELGISVSATISQIEIDGLKRILRPYDIATTEERESIFNAFDAYDAVHNNKAKVIRENGIWELAKKYSVTFSQDEAEKIFGKYYTSTAKQSEAESLKARMQIMTIMKVLGISTSSTLDTLESDCLERICRNYQNADEEMCNKIIERISSFDALEKNKQPFLHKIQARIESIWAKEDGEIFDNLYLNTNILDPEDLKKAIAFVKEKGRTSSSGKYLSALTGCTQENIEKAKKFQKPITKCFMYGGFAMIGVGIILLLADLGFILSLAVAAIGIVMLVYYYGLKKIWSTLTLDGTIIHKMLSISGKEERRQTAMTPEEEAAKIEKTAKIYDELEKMEEKKNAQK